MKFSLLNQQNSFCKKSSPVLEATECGKSKQGKRGHGESLFSHRFKRRMKRRCKEPLKVPLSVSPDSFVSIIQSSWHKRKASSLKVALRNLKVEEKFSSARRSDSFTIYDALWGVIMQNIPLTSPANDVKFNGKIFKPEIYGIFRLKLHMNHDATALHPH